MCGDEDVDTCEEGGEGALAQELHLHIDEEVPWALDLPLQVHRPSEAVEAAGAEVALLIPPRDADDDVIA